MRIASGAQVVVAEGLLFDIRKWVRNLTNYYTSAIIFLTKCFIYFL
jgi:hypothetical protein